MASRLLAFISLFICGINSFAQSTVRFSTNEKHPNLQLKTPIGWIGNAGYFVAEIDGKQNLVCVDSSYNLISNSPVQEELEGASYHTTIMLGHTLYSLFYNDSKGDEQDLRLYASTIDLKTLKITGKTIKIYNQEGGAKKLSRGQIASNDLFNKFVISPNHNYILFYSELTSDSSSTRFVRTCSLDTSLTLLSSGRFNVGSKLFFSIENSNIDDKGDGFISGFIFTGKLEQTPNSQQIMQQEYYLLYLAKNAKLFSLKVSVDRKLIASVHGLTTSNQDLIVYGGYSEQDHDNTKGLFIKYFNKTASIKNEQIIQFDEVFIGQHSETNKKKEIYKYSILKTYYNETTQNIVIIADRITDDITRSNVYISVISSSGQLIKNYNIARKAFYRSYDNSDPIYIFYSLGRIHIIFNNDIRNTSPQLKDNEWYGALDMQNGCVSDYTLDENFNLTNKVLYNFPEKKEGWLGAAISITPDNTVILAFFYNDKNPFGMVRSYSLSDIR